VVQLVFKDRGVLCVPGASFLPLIQGREGPQIRRIPLDGLLGAASDCGGSTFKGDQVSTGLFVLIFLQEYVAVVGSVWPKVFVESLERPRSNRSFVLAVSFGLKVTDEILRVLTLSLVQSVPLGIEQSRCPLRDLLAELFLRESFIPIWTVEEGWLVQDGYFVLDLLIHWVWELHLRLVKSFDIYWEEVIFIALIVDLQVNSLGGLLGLIEVLPDSFSKGLLFGIRVVFQHLGFPHGLIEGLSGLVQQVEKVIVVCLHLYSDLVLYPSQLLSHLMFLLRKTYPLKNVGALRLQSILLDYLDPAD